MTIIAIQTNTDQVFGGFATVFASIDVHTEIICMLGFRLRRKQIQSITVMSQQNCSKLEILVSESFLIIE